MTKTHLKRLMRTYTLSAHQLSYHTGISVSTITRFLNGSTKKLHPLTNTCIEKWFRDEFREGILERGSHYVQ